MHINIKFINLLIYLYKKHLSYQILKQTIVQINQMSYLDAQTLQKSIIGKSVLMAEPIRIQSTPDIQNVPGLKLKSQQDFANADMCNICKQPFNPQRNVNRHHCRICAISACGQCSRKRINNQRACDFCFLKQCLKKQQHQRKQQFRLRQQNIQKMNRQISQFQKQIQELDKQIIVVDRNNIQCEVKNAKQISDRQQQMRQRQQTVKVKQEEYQKKKIQLLSRKQELQSRQDRNKMYSSKVQIIKLDISSKQSTLLEKMQQLQRLKIQLDKLDSQKDELLAEFK